MTEVRRLLGRDQELRQVETLLSHARNGHGGALLLAGEPGIGKSALLDSATSELVGMEVLRADGYEAESTIPYAGLQRLMISLRGHLTALPEWHQRVLRVAAGAAEGLPPDRFVVGLGVLGLLAAAGESRPVVCAIDDAHLLDSESLDALAFVARRLEAEAAAVVIASRDSDAVARALTGVPKLRVSGLAHEPAIALLAASMPKPIDPAAAAHIAAATGGNPLALIDLAKEVDVKQLSESSLADEPVPIGIHLETFYLQKVRSLAAETQLWLLVAAADSTGNLDLIRAAGAELGISEVASEAVENAGLVTLGVTARFRHPLVRSAAYGAATGAERRRVHAALATAAADLTHVELEAWHAAKATLGTDSSVADRLERVADLAGQRGGFSSRASVLLQAAGLTPAGSLKQHRLVAAAEATLATGATQLAGSMLGEVDQDTVDALTRAKMAAVRASVAMFTADPAVRTSTAEMLAAGQAARFEDARMEQDSLIQAFYFILPTERLALGVTLPELGSRLEAGAELRDGVAASILRGLSALILLPYRDAVPRMREAVEVIKGLDDFGMLRYGPISVVLTSALWDAGGWREAMERTAAVARETGSLRLLDVTLWAMSMAELRCGTPRRSEEYLDQIRELRGAIGYDAEHVTNPALLAWSGASADEVQRAAEGARMVGLGALHAAGLTALAARELADGAYADAYFRLKPFVDDPFLHVTPLEYQDFVEAAVRSGRTNEAVPIVELLENLADINGSNWTVGVAARSRAMVDDSEPHFQAALAALDGSRVDIELARTHLLYGEWLRRRRSRRQAADHLHRASAIFEHGHALAFARRAGRELEALGETPHSTNPLLPGAPALTTQEMTVARLAASGNTNAEIGATMFLSVNTVDYHLRKVFQKLGISSRRQLADHLDPAS